MQRTVDGGDEDVNSAGVSDPAERVGGLSASVRVRVAEDADESVNSAGVSDPARAHRRRTRAHAP